jgi:IclR family transcriptional regulator, pca regulon regulatory protein
MTLSEIAVQTGLTRATARRFLHTLVEIGYVRTDGKTFALTPHVLELGFSYLSALSLPEIAQPHLDAFSRATGESSSLAVLDSREIVYVARAAAKRVMSVSITVGTRFPAHATSMGRVLLAAEGTGVPEGIDLRAMTPASITTREELEAELARVREQGYALVDQELEIGLRSLALPILDAGAVTVAAINVSVSAGEYSIERMREELLPQLAETAQSIEATMTKAPRTV